MKELTPRQIGLRQRRKGRGPTRLRNFRFDQKMDENLDTICRALGVEVHTMGLAYALEQMARMVTKR